MREFGRRIDKVVQIYVDTLERIPAEPVVNVTRYTFRIDTQMFRSMIANAESMADLVMLEGGEDSLWFFKSYVEVASTRGTAQQFANLANQSPAYKSGRQSLNDILTSLPHRRRIALLQTREYEELRGLSSQVKTDMARLLTDGMARGQNPRRIAKTLREQAGIEKVRAERIARTEINTALRRARMDEADEATELYGLQTKEMHISALSPTTRITHAARHARIFTRDQQRDWWSRDANSINCKCTTVSVMVDNQGNPLVPGIVERARRNKEVMQERGEGPWAKQEQ